MDFEQQLRDEEGEKLYAYQDHLGYWTIGVGILIDKKKGGGLRKEESDFILRNRIRLQTAEVEKALPWSKDLDEPRKAVLVGMAFQMGLDGLLGFKNTLKMIERRQYKEAGAGMLNSLWAKQTPARAKRMAKQMETGQWQRKS